jgi:hypothetical protein
MLSLYQLFDFFLVLLVQMTIDLARHKAEILIVVNTNNDAVIIINIVLSNASAKI